MQNILIIDDDKITHAFIKKALSEHYSIYDAYNGEDGLKASEDIKPDIILLDVEMPGKNGYQVCQSLKSSDTCKHIPIIFLSANAGPSDIMLGFESGADDYVVKPFQAEALLAKVNIITRHTEDKQQLNSKIAEAQKKAYSAIANTGDLGQTLHFINQCYGLTHVDSIAEALFNITNTLELNCAIFIETPNQDCFYASNNKSIPPLEEELIGVLRSEDHFFSFGNRTQINYQHISLLIKNMPSADSDRHVQIKKLLPTMLTAADTKISQLNTLQAISKHTHNIQSSFALISNVLSHIKSAIDKNQSAGIKIMRKMMMDLDTKLPKMGLEDDQERYIINQVDNAINETHSTINVSQEITKDFTLILKALQGLVNKQEHLQNEISKLAEVPEDEKK